MAFAENLDFCMRAKGYSAYRLAIILGVNNQSVLNWQHGERTPHKKTRIKIAEHFGITLEELDGDALPVLPSEKADQGIKKDTAGIGGVELTDMQKEAWDLLQKMDDDTLRRFIAAAKAMLGE